MEDAPQGIPLVCVCGGCARAKVKDIKFWEDEIKRLEREKNKLEESVEHWNKRIKQLEKDQEKAALGKAEAQKGVDNAEMHQGTPTDY